jgi:hypothetical protein
LIQFSVRRAGYNGPLFQAKLASRMIVGGAAGNPGFSGEN